LKLRLVDGINYSEKKADIVTVECLFVLEEPALVRGALKRVIHKGLRDESETWISQNYTCAGHNCWGLCDIPAI